jgi:predicted ArsR family transcriptional regulator
VTQGDLFTRRPAPEPKKEPLAPFQRHSETSRLAAVSVHHRKAGDREDILALLKREGPLTDEAVQEMLCLNPSTERPRRIELVRDGLVVEAGTGKTRSGRSATLWKAA